MAIQAASKRRNPVVNQGWRASLASNIFVGDHPTAPTQRNTWEDPDWSGYPTRAQIITRRKAELARKALQNLPPGSHRLPAQTRERMRTWLYEYDSNVTDGYYTFD